MKLLLLLIALPAALFTHAQKPDYWIVYTDTASGESLSGYKKQDGTVALTAKYLWVNTDTFYKMAIVFDHGWVGIDRNEQVVLKPFIFDNGPDYVVEGLFRFEEDGKMGFADTNGNKVIPARYSFAAPFSGGLSEYVLGGHKQYEQGGEHWYWTGGYEQGYVNRSGQEFERAGPLKDKRREAWTRDGKHVLLDKAGMVIRTLNP